MLAPLKLKRVIACFESLMDIVHSMALMKIPLGLNRVVFEIQDCLLRGLVITNYSGCIGDVANGCACFVVVVKASDGTAVH